MSGSAASRSTIWRVTSQFVAGELGRPERLREEDRR